MAFACAPADRPVEIPPASPGLEVRREGYAEARRSFRTRLIRPGPASLDRGPILAPADADGVVYRSGELALKAFASRPTAGGRPKPAVLFLHGGFSLGEGHWAMTRPFRESGFAVMVPSLRGENGQGGASSMFHDEVDDVLAAADWLAGRPDVDPSRLFLAGHSVGGTMTLLAAMASDRFRAAASFSGSPDQIEFTRNRTERIPFDPSDRAEFRMRSPVAFATSFRCPVRLYHGEDEFWLQPATVRTALLAKRAGLDVEAVEVPGGHDSANPTTLAECIAFFRAHD